MSLLIKAKVSIILKGRKRMNELAVNGVDSNAPTPKKNIAKRIIDFIISIFLIFIILIGSYFIILNSTHTLVVIDGDSMFPTLVDKEFGLMKTNEKAINKIKRNSIIIIEDAGEDDLNSRLIIKRVVGLPNETIQIFDRGGTNPDYIEITPLNGETFIFEEPDIGDTYLSRTHKVNENACGEPLTLGKDEYFVLGDNRGSSFDSRAKALGPIKQENIKAVLYVIQGAYKKVETEYVNGKEVKNYLDKSYRVMWKWRYY